MHELNSLQELYTFWLEYKLKRSCECALAHSHPVCENHIPFGATIRYLLMFVHRRDLEQSSVSRFLSDDRVRVCYAKSHLYTLPNFASLIEYKKTVDSLILGSGEECGRDSDWGFSEIRRLMNYNHLAIIPANWFSWFLNPWSAPLIIR